MQIQIKHRWTEAVLWEGEAEDIKDAVKKAVASGSNLSGSNLRGSNLSDSNLSDSDLRGSNLRGSNLRGSNLSGSNLRGSNLRGSNLRGSDLRDSNLSDSNLSGSDLRGSNLRGSNLRGSDLRDSNLSDSNLSGSDLRGSNLSGIKADVWEILLRAPAEVAGLAAAIKEGRIKGSAYRGACACLVGTIANIRGVDYCTLEGIAPSSDRPAERWFLGIKEGDTPETSQISKITLEWVEEFQRLIGAAAKALGGKEVA